MATTCESIISKDIVVACGDQVTRGFESDGVIINRQDIDFAKTVFDESNPNIIKTLVLKKGKKAYAIRQEGNSPFKDANVALNVGDYRNTWDTELPIMILANTPDVCYNIVDGLANGKYVCIVRNVTKGADGKGEYQVIGYQQGLKASAGSCAEDTEGGWLITLKEEKAPKCALFFFNTDSETTATQYESLKTDPV